MICDECVSTTHRNHLNEPISRVAKCHLSNLRQAADRAKTVVEESAVASSKLAAASKKIEAHCNKVHYEVEKFIEDYIKAVEDHKITLLEQIKQVHNYAKQSFINFTYLFIIILFIIFLLLILTKYIIIHWFS